MNTLKSFRNMLAWLLVLLMAIPSPIFAQDSKATPKKFSQEELDQVLAPVALYPDSLLAQVFIAATYPLEVVTADRWARQNKDLKGEALNNALGKQPWDASVKALVPFPDVLSMMSQKLDWTQKVGDAFLEQQADVMDTVQKLRKRAADAGNLKSTEQQKVIVEREVIRVEPVHPQVVYVPVYDPWWVYGPWWWPAYPPYSVYPYYPAGVVFASGLIWFDYDNDGFQDLLVTGAGYGGPVAAVYHNDQKGGFTEIETSLKPVSVSAVAVGDYDNDGFVDIAVSGGDDFGTGSNPTTKIYHNEGDGKFLDIGADLEGTWFGSLDWGDFDNDGRLDLLVTGATLRYGLSQRTTVQLTVYNALGQQVATLVQGEQGAGYHEVTFEASGLSSGVYLYRMQAGTFVEVKRLLLVR